MYRVSAQGVDERMINVHYYYYYYYYYFDSGSLRPFLLNHLFHPVRVLTSVFYLHILLLLLLLLLLTMTIAN